MKKLALALAFVAALCFSALTAAAQKHSGGHGKPSHKGSLKTIGKTKAKHKHRQHSGAAH